MKEYKIKVPDEILVVNDENEGDQVESVRTTPELIKKALSAGNIRFENSGDILVLESKPVNKKEESLSENKELTPTIQKFLACPNCGSSDLVMQENSSGGTSIKCTACGNVLGA